MATVRVKGLTLQAFSYTALTRHPTLTELI